MSRARWATGLVVARRVGIVLLFVLVLVRPGFGVATVQRQATDLEVLVVVDRTRSMAALDWDGDRPRFEGVQRDLDALAQQLPGARFALVTFGRVVRTELPFTSDTQTFTTAVDTIALEDPLDGSGSLVDRPLDEMRALLQDAEAQYPDRPRMVLFASDGENTAGGEQRSFAELDQYVDGGAVLGYGTPDGAPMPLAEDLSPDDGYLTDSEGEQAVSRLDEDNLRTVADQLGVTYERRDAPGGLGPVVDSVEAGTVTVEDTATVEREVTWAFAAGLLALLLLELRRSWRGLLTAREGAR